MAEFQGLYVKIGGDTVEFEKSVNGVNKALNTLKKDMQNLNKSLKFDPDNVDLLNAKLGNLAEQSRMAELKIIELKAKQDALGKGEVGSAQWAKLQMEINKTQAEMTSLDRAMETTRNHLEEVVNPESVYNLNKALKETQEDLELVNRKLELDPNNVELAEQKMQLLQKAADLANKKVEALKKEQADLGEANIGTPEWRDLERQIVQAQIEARGFENELNNVGNTADSSLGNIEKGINLEMLQNAADKLSVVGDKLKEVGAAAIDAWSNVDRRIDNFTKRTGLSGDVVDDLYKKIASTMPIENLDQITDAAGELFSTMGMAVDELEPATEQFIKFSEVTGTDVVTAIQDVHKVQRQYNIDVSDTSSTLDKFLSATQNSNLSIEQLSGSLLKGSEEAQQLGLGFDGMLGLLVDSANAGIEYDAVLKSMNKATVTYAKEGKTLSEGLQETAIAYQNAGSKADKMNIIANIFGSKNAPMIAKALDEGKISLTDFGTTGVDALNSVNNTFNATLDGYDQQTVMTNNMELAMSELGGVIQDSLAPAFTFLTDVIQNATQWFTNLSPGMQRVIIVSGIIITVLAILIPIILTITVSVIGLTTATTALNISLLPIILTVAAVVAGIILLIAIIMNWGAITDWIKAKWEVVKQFFSNLWTNITSFFTNAFSNIKNSVSGFISSVINFFNNLGNNIRNTVSSLWSNVVSFFSNGVSNVINTVSNIGSRIANFFSGLPEKIMAAIGNISQIGKNIVDGIISGLGNLGSALWNAVTTAISNLPSISNIIASMFGKSEIGLADGIGDIGGAASQFFNVKSFGIPFVKSSGEGSTTTLNISVNATNSNEMDIARTIERVIVRRLKGR